ncbi:MAG: UDP-N-acetyl-D-mannosamine dehydrogenase [Candidatus Methylumidiphilus sp.]
MFEKISMIGLGYIGLPTATLFASRKKMVIGVDVLPHVVNTINQGRIHIVEPELDMLVHAAVTEGYLRATLTPEPADAFLVAVPTPFKEGHKPDLSYIEAAAKMIAPVLCKGNLVILESTSPVGSTELLAEWMAAARPDLSFPQTAGEEADIQVAHCPERVLPGRVLHELVSNDRVIGGLTRKASALAVELYKSFVEGECIVTDARTAEMCKLTENSFRDVNIAFANELSIVCGKLGIDVWELIPLANLHPRVNILQPGAGVGGHCIAVDPWFIVDSAPEEARIIRAAREVNEHKPTWVVEKVKAAVADVLATGSGRDISEITVACLGLAFKPDIDDLRESPAVGICAALARTGCQCLAVEPHVGCLPKGLAELGVCLTGLDDALAKADVICVLVRHSDFLRAKANIAAAGVVVDAVGLLAGEA